ncbi:hypothetical protein WKW79_02995 [Variovorax robiniae]|uniref:Uncharacterized protein n=1 Tax=Variovorax robiniae TaxID=1836199 RepID=A0ABU8X167_9BURK
MRSLGLVGLVLALVIVGLLVKKQMNTLMPAAVPPVAGAPAPNVREQSQQIQQQVRQQVEAAMQQPRPLPDDAK